MKKWIAWTLALAMLISCCVSLASCTEDDEKDKETQETTRAEEDTDNNDTNDGGNNGNNDSNGNSGTQGITSLWSGEVDRSWYSVLDTEFTLTTGEQLAGLAQIVNEGADFLNVTVKLGANIDLNNLPWTPIGTETAFAGTFDGCGHTVSNCNVQAYMIEYDDGVLYDGDACDLYAGFFAKVKGSIKNLNLDHVVIDIDNATQEFNSVYVGGLVSYAGKGKITSCTSNGNVQCTVKAGGLMIGGLVGYSSFSGTGIMDCASNGSISFAYTYADTRNYSYCLVGGLVGESFSNIERSSSTVSIQGSADRALSVGGLLGEGSGGDYIRNCYATGDISIQSFSASIGGLSAGSDSRIENCYATGNILITPSSENISYCEIGGLCVWSSSDIKNCWASGNITISRNPVGEYNARIGTLIPDNYSEDIINCYHYSGQTISGGTEVEIYTQGTPASESDLKSARLYTERLGWNSAVWNFEDGKYPTLKAPDANE